MKTINWTITTDPEELALPTKTEQKAKQNDNYKNLSILFSVSQRASKLPNKKAHMQYVSLSEK